MENKVLSSWISLNENRNPQKIAVIDGGRRITYSELHDYGSNLAGWLISRGIQRGDRVVMLLPNSSEFVISFLAIASAGAVAVPLNVQYKADELSGYFMDSSPRAVIASARLVPLVKEVISGINHKGCDVIGVPEGRNEQVSFVDAMKGNILFHRKRDLQPDDEVLCQYSSGSTGKPKRIVRTHANLVSEAENLNATVAMSGDDKILCVVPLFHAHGFGNCMLASLYAGATLVILEDFNRRKVLKTIQDERITVFPGVPFMFSILAATPVGDDSVLSSLRLCFSAGAPLQQETFRGFFEKYGVPVRQLYGTSETGSVSINLNKNISDTADSVGLPVRNVDVEIFGEKGEILPSDQTGEIGIKSPAMIRGYSGAEDLNRESFRGGYFFPLDLGKKDSNGNIYIVGRKSLFINAGGVKVDPSEIEILLAKHPKIKEVVVVGAKSYYGEGLIKAVVVPGSPCDEKEIIEFCMGKIADFKIPRIVEFRDEIPRSPLGKVLRKYL
ncbi:MAG: acyl--CoA ligase [Candidatus Brocadia sp.]|jgi:long-chain acyl-CoA synthetase